MTWTVQPQLELAEEQIQLWANKLERDTGVQLGQLQTSLLSSQIASRMRELSLYDPDDYYAWVCSHPPEWSTLLERLLVKETHFFRNREVLKGIKQFVAQKIQTESLAKSFDVWSLGCATGEEAYSLAASLHDSFSLAPKGCYFSVTGLDISAGALATARAGVYSKSRLALATKSETTRLFEAHKEGFKVKDEIAQRVTFVKGNLCAIDNIPHMPMDVIVCLNVLIYFRRWRRRDLLNKLVDRLKPNGLLIIGSGDMPGWQNSELKTFTIGGAQAYQRQQSLTVAH